VVKNVLQFWRMEFLQVPETPAPEPVEPDVPDCCGDEKIGESAAGSVDGFLLINLHKVFAQISHD